MTFKPWIQRLRAARGWRAAAASAAFGIVSALALPPLHLIPLLLIAIPGLLVLVDAAPNWRHALLRGYCFGLGHHIVGLYWITEAILVESAHYWWLVPFAVPALAAIMAPFIAIPCAAARMAAPGLRRVALFAGVWTLADLARQFVGTGFPWNPFGSVWAIPGVLGDVLIQPAAWIGTPGLTLVTILLAATPLLGWRGMAGGASVLAAWAVFGVVRLHRSPDVPTGITVVLVQGNVQQGQKWDRATAITTFDRQLALTRQGVAEAGPGRVVVVWPETSSVFLLQDDAAARQAIVGAAGHASAALVGGITFPKGHLTTLDDPANLPHNSLIALTPDGTIAGTYDKWHLVPFGEYAPSWVPFSVKLVPGVLGFGTGPETLDVPDVPPFGGLICYEAIFPGQVVDMKNRPDWLVNITNDAWFGNSSGPRQHLAAVRLRAVEEGLPIMRAANTGISAGFDAVGREQNRIAMNKADVLALRLYEPREATPFSRWGLVIPGVLAVAVSMTGLGLNRKRVIKWGHISQL